MLLLVGSLFRTAERAAAKDTIKWEDDTPKIEVKATGLFGRTPAPGLRNSQTAPAGSRARELAVDNYRFDWKPRWNFIGLGGAILPFALESGDESVFGIIETLPQEGAPTSSIIVFMNLYNRQLINYLVMTGEDVRKFCYIPFSRNIVGLIKAPYDKYEPEPKFRFQTIDTHSGSRVSISPWLKTPAVAFCCSRDGRLFAAFGNSDKIRVYEANKLSRGFTTVKAVADPVALNCSADGRTLVAAGSSQVRFFDIQQQPMPEKTLELPAFFHPDKLVLCAADAAQFLVSVFGGPSYFYNGSRFVKLCNCTDADINWSISERRLLIGLPQKSVIAVYNPQNPETPEIQFRFRTLRPATTGKLFKIISLPGNGTGIAVLDRLGALSHIYRKKHRWVKNIIIEPPKP